MESPKEPCDGVVNPVFVVDSPTTHGNGTHRPLVRTGTDFQYWDKSGQNGTGCKHGQITNGKTHGLNGFSGKQNGNGNLGNGKITANGTPNGRGNHTEELGPKADSCRVCIEKTCMAKYHPLPENASCCRRFCHAFLCPPHGHVASVLTGFVLVVLFWAVLWAIIGKDVLPGGNIFALVMMLIGCTVAGKLVELIRFPSLLGMLLMGFLLRNIPVVNVAEDIDREWSSALRLIALVVILIRAGLGLDFQRLRTMSGAVFRLSVLPFSTEVVVAAGLSIVMFSFPWDWAFMLGFVHAAVSPAVVIPSMILLQQRRLGTNKGIPTMAIAAGSIENVLAISAFSLTLGISFSEGSLVFNILRCPMEIALGILYGVLFGILLWFLPETGQGSLAISRFTLLLGGGLLSTFGSRVAQLPGAGALGCLVLAFTAAHGWRKTLGTGKEQLSEVAGMVQLAWGVVFQPLLFGLIGAEVRVSDLQKEVIGTATVIALVAVVVRCLVSFVAVFGANLKHKEKLFVSLSWVPKATVQAAIGSIALDTVERLGLDDSEIQKGRIVLTVAVYVIILTAPLGALLISTTAPKLLSQEPEEQIQTDDKDSHNNETKSTDTISEDCKSTERAESDSFSTHL